jgi:hypothetical protein
MSEQQTTETLSDLSLAAYRATRETPAEATPAKVEDKTPASGAQGAGETETEGEVESTEQASANDGPASQEKQSQKKGGFQRKIDKQTREIEDLKRQLAERSAAQPQGDKGEKTEGAAAPAQPSQPQLPAYEKPKPKLEDFDSIETFTDALTDWKADKRDFDNAQKAEQSRAQADAQKVLDGWNSRTADAKKSHADYNEVLSSVDDVELSPAHQRIFLESEHGPELAYQLAQDRESLEKFAGMNPLAAARFLGKLEASLSSEAAPDENTVSKAPRPVRPVGARASAGKFNVADASLADYRKARESGRI